MDKAALEKWIRNRMVKYQAERHETIGTTRGFYDGKLEFAAEVLRHLEKPDVES